MEKQMTLKYRLPPKAIQMDYQEMELLRLMMELFSLLNQLIRKLLPTGMAINWLAANGKRKSMMLLS